MSFLRSGSRPRERSFDLLSFNRTPSFSSRPTLASPLLSERDSLGRGRPILLPMLPSRPSKIRDAFEFRSERNNSGRCTSCFTVPVICHETSCMCEISIRHEAVFKAGSIAKSKRFGRSRCWAVGSRPRSRTSPPRICPRLSGTRPRDARQVILRVVQIQPLFIFLSHSFFR